MDLDTLVQRAKEKDPNAFDIIYRTYYPKMVGICMNIIREDRATVDDLVHDAFIMAFVSIGSLRDNTKFSEWLTTIVRNVSLKHIEQRDRIRIQPISSINAEDVVLVDSSSSPESDLNHKELLELISLLPEGYRNILRLSVIEGFSHKEIAEMLGIEPHSSSSQLSRAKRFLKSMIAGRMVGFIALILVPLTLYFMFRQEKEQPKEIAAPLQLPQRGENNLNISHRDNCPLEAEHSGRVSVQAPKVIERAALAKMAGDSVLPSDTDSLLVNPESNISHDILITKTAEDSLDANIKDSININIERIFPEINITEEHRRKSKKWQFLAAGSLGPALAQNVYRLFAVNSSSSVLPEPDTPLPNYIHTWEEYCRYLKAVASPNASADTLALIEIAEHSTGEITQREHHDRPITFGISLTKSLGRKWNLETGIQYSLLNSQFYMGDRDTIVDTQKVHYLGIPLRVSYNWTNYKRLSMYSSFGVTLHIPVYGKVDSRYYISSQNAYSGTKYFTPSLQWQTGVSLGLQYNFAPHTSLFAEPTFNWFIPSGSEIHTIWTEHPIMFTCPFGIRITW